MGSINRHNENKKTRSTISATIERMSETCIACHYNGVMLRACLWDSLLCDSSAACCHPLYKAIERRQVATCIADAVIRYFCFRSFWPLKSRRGCKRRRTAAEGSRWGGGYCRGRRRGGEAIERFLSFARLNLCAIPNAARSVEPFSKLLVFFFM